MKNLSKKQLFIIGYIAISIIISIIFFTNNIQHLSKEKTNENLQGKWIELEKNNSVLVEIENEDNYLIKYKNENDNCYYHFNGNIYNLNYEDIKFDLIYLNVLEGSCGNEYKNQKLVFKIDRENTTNKAKIKYVNAEELNKLVAKLKTTKEIEDNIKRLVSLFNVQTKLNNHYNNFELNFIKE